MTTQITSFEDYKSTYKRSVEEPEAFWIHTIYCTPSLRFPLVPPVPACENSSPAKDH